MAQRSHVPKFGNWEGDNVPYTAFFENARKEKTGGVRINPNDPEQNPEAFNIGGPRDGRISPDRQVAPRRFANERSGYDQQKRDSRRIVASESSSDRSPSDSSVNKPKLHHKKSDRNKYTSDGHVPPSPGPYSMNQADDFLEMLSLGKAWTRVKLVFDKCGQRGTRRGRPNSYRAASVPKFGQWDENDPRSAEGFTVIFNKVKEEKQITATKFPPVPTQTNYQTSQEKESRKRCCCLF